jgi:uncharacterized protein with HEPN domain
MDEERLRGSLWDHGAVVRNLEVIGEASKHPSQATRDLAPEIQWSRIAGFRDVAIPGHDLVDVGRVWAIVKNDLPMLKKNIRRPPLKLEPTG